ncbi:MAG: enoyl-CoA hydratase/isomerase family protein [Phycisphaerales bacterium]|nr:enoyl-CoA hydratase/isomerase family protein [Phycisphaerales bacterium]
MPEPLPVSQVESGPHAGIVVVRLEQPGKPVVVLEQELIQRLEATLNAVPKAARGLVLASASERVFVAGADLQAIQALNDDQLARYLAYAARVFGMLATFPFPTCAAINGAALGGGLELAMHCDGLVAAPPPNQPDGSPGRVYPVGLPEAGLKICPGWGGTNMLPARMDPEQAIRMTAAGTPMTFPQACEAGVFDAVAPSSDALLATAMEWINAKAARGRLERDGAPSRWIGRPANASGVLSAFDRVKGELGASEPGASVMAAIDAGLTRGWSEALNVEQRQLIRLRNAPAGKDAIAAFFAKKK